MNRLKSIEPQQIIVKNQGRIGFLGLLCLVFVAGKIFGKLAWSWWWVFAPIWAPFALFAGMLLTFGIGIGVVFVGAVIVDAIKAAKRRR